MANQFERAPLPGSAEYQFAGRSYFYIEREWPRYFLLLSLIGLIGLCATWIFAWIFGNGFPEVGLTAAFGALLLHCGLRVMTGPYYGSWFADGTLHWQQPNRFYGRSDSCRVSDVAEFQILVPPSGDSGGPDLTYRVLLKNGATKSLNPSCFGYYTQGLIRALQNENPTIVVARVERERSGWTHSASLDSKLETPTPKSRNP
jgi:hypothetical protein